MQYRSRGEKLSSILNKNLSVETQQWYHEKVSQIIEKKSAKDLYLFYSLLRREIPKDSILVNSLSKEDQEIIHLEKINLLELSRIVVLIKILLADESFFSSKVSKLIEVADTSELEAFLKYLVYIPNPSTYRSVGVEALRTNIETIFCAIALNNPYPSSYFNDQQWNQMYLKAAFMQLDLSKILDIDKRSNRDLTRIISDYAHERWAASRKIDPYFWRPVSGFMEAIVLGDMKHLLQSEDKAENYAAALCCLNSESPDALELLDKYPEIKKEISSKSISWNNLKTVL
ncbi:EboA domain-containing protein [Eudoraea chungangensis]|uniref:EboA domain-containing protein n=1 Tax=Eudoraea chungangensis TaxID=1481905 RepID=UPI0023ED418C|nr:EboA domain-containing protein [Eudoraea chungangensis]